MSIIRIEEVDLKQKRVLIRADLNVPLKDGVITDDTRIRASLTGIKQALTAGAAVLVMSHLGRPTEGQWDPACSLAPVAKKTDRITGTNSFFNSGLDQYTTVCRFR